MQQWTTREPLALRIDVARVSRLDLEFREVRRDGGTFTFFVFLNVEDLPPDAGRDHPNFAAASTVFAESRCWGGPAHCDWEREAASAFDRRPEHHLLPFNLALDVTTAVKRLGNPDGLSVTIHAASLSDPEATEVFRFREVVALAYQ